jgi:hypothetical protein
MLALQVPADGVHFFCIHGRHHHFTVALPVAKKVSPFRR